MLKQMILLAGISASMAALAVEPSYQRPPETATEALLRLQSSNQQASSTLQIQTASERDQSMHRWLETYKYQIPDFFRWVKSGAEDN
ncbi:MULTISPECIES: DUF3613 domain-containing protein [Pseudomonas]|uniref:Uncharacterized protein n=1 Tax=Pseudomonas hunanensis TaxID=1247546 RepID=A0ACC6K0N1_9PSED|nr:MULTISPECIES: DUF3613 domain-containing protein [Pseudomonas]MBP2264307.1 hypothetical protein [Pseudomonas sp. BP8]MDR6712011.1 hypothetical protein [Pseudomonas hunanensis]HDS1735840.1 DUF3613 domain-containing protein [Pseudomonas putida]